MSDCLSPVPPPPHVTAPGASWNVQVGSLNYPFLSLTSTRGSHQVTKHVTFSATVVCVLCKQQQTKTFAFACAAFPMKFRNLDVFDLLPEVDFYFFYVPYSIPFRFLIYEPLVLRLRLFSRLFSEVGSSCFSV